MPLPDSALPMLVIETSDVICGAAVFTDAAKYALAQTAIPRVHSTGIFPRIEDALRAAGVNAGGIASVAVSVGPGSFTGLRIGLSAAKGIALGAGIPLIPVPTFEAMAYAVIRRSPVKEFIIASSASVKEYYFARFINEGNIYKFEEPLGLIQKTELPGVAGSVPVFGNCQAGAASVYFYYPAPSPAEVGEWALAFGNPVQGGMYDILEPLYIKDFIVKGKE